MINFAYTIYNGPPLAFIVFVGIPAAVLITAIALAVNFLPPAFKKMIAAIKDYKAKKQEKKHSGRS